MKIAVISSTIYPARRVWIYGSEVESFLLAEQLGKMDVDVLFYCAGGSEKSKYFNKFRYLPSSTNQIGADYELYVVNKYHDELKECDFIIDMSALLLASEYANNNNIPFYAFRNGNGLTYPLCRKNIVVLSKLVQELHPDVPSTVIPYGIDQDFYTMTDKRSNDYFLYLSRPHRDKGILNFISIAHALPDVKFIMAYSTIGYDHKYWSDIALKDLPGNVEYVDLNNDFNGSKKLELLRNARAMILPLQDSYKEAFGLVIAEAMSCGTKVITNGNSISKDQWMDDGKSVLELTNGDIDEYIDKVKGLCNNDYSHENVRKFIIKHYSKEVYVNNWLEAIKKQLDSRDVVKS